MKFEMSEEMMNDALESAFAESGDEEETDAIIGKASFHSKPGAKF